MTDAVDNNNQIAIFMEISGMNYDMAKETLAMHNNNLEQAINYHLEGGSEDTDTTNQCVASSSTSRSDNSKERQKKHSLSMRELSYVAVASTSTQVNNDFISNAFDEDNVRAPIPPKREQIIMPEEDIFRNRKRRIVPLRTACPLRNFELEGRLQEEQLEAAVLNNLSEGSDGIDNNFASMPNGQALKSRYANSNNKETFQSNIKPKRSRLSDLYRPPVDISFAGPLQAARDYSKSQNRWLIVNVQDNKDFNCQILNRDIWSNARLREILKKYFIFWQVAIDNSEGLRFQAFYSITNFPYIGIIDPVTGEEKLSFKDEFNLQADHFIEELKNYLKTNTPYPNPDEARGTTDLCEVDFSDLALSDEHSINKIPSSSSSSSSLSSLSSPTKNKKRRLVIEPSSLSEQEQIELAIGRSLQEVTTNSKNSKKLRSGDNSDAEEDDDDDDVNDDDYEDDEEEVNTFDDDSEDNSLPSKQNPPSTENNIEKRTTDEDKEIDNIENEVTSMSNSYQSYIGLETDPKTRIQLRLPSGERHILEWPCSSKIKALKLFIPEQFPAMANESYKIICPFNAVVKKSADFRSSILDMNEMLTLEEACLHPTVTLYLQTEE